MARPAKYRLSPDEVLAPENARKLAGHVSEIEFFRAEVEKLQAQIAGIYDAADDDGFDKKFIRKAVARRAKEGPALEAEENAVECYVEAVKKGLPTRTREGNPVDDLPAHDDQTGEILETDEQFAAGVETMRSRVGAVPTDLVVVDSWQNHEPLPPEPAAREAGDDAVAGASSSGRTEPSADGQPIPEAPTPLPADQGQRAAVSITPVQQPAEAKTSDQEPLSNGSGEMQDECAIHLPDNSPAIVPEWAGKNVSAAPVNPRCLKAQNGEDCWMAHKSYCCSGCTAAWALNRQHSKRVPA